MFFSQANERIKYVFIAARILTALRGFLGRFNVQQDRRGARTGGSYFGNQKISCRSQKDISGACSNNAVMSEHSGRFKLKNIFRGLVMADTFMVVVRKP